MSDILRYKSAECKHDNSCIISIAQKFIKNFSLGFAVKFILRLLTERNLKKIM